MKKISTLKFCLFLSVILFSQNLFSQNYTQTVKGTVIDLISEVPLPGANVIVLETSPSIGAITDAEGNFKLENVPIGRYDIQVTYLGYENSVQTEVQVATGKEVVLTFKMQEKINQISDVVVTGYTQKDKPLNTMATISARSFSVEETRRYAGGLDDPARMVSAFAGVTVGNLQDNAIVIRGNSPKGVQWKLEGIEIPNPNHLAGANVAGGGFVTVFSSQLLSNSDFFTSAFPAEYGNALAGVFDMKLRTGNRDIRETTFQVGVLGIDFASEGPFVKGKKATYLFNYRYSTFGLLVNFGIIPTEQVPIYQDLSFKLNFPTNKIGTFSLWGVGGMDKLKDPEEIDSSKWTMDWSRISFTWKSNMGATGLTHKYLIGKSSYINTTIAATGTNNVMDQWRYNDNLVNQQYTLLSDNSGKIVLSSFFNHKLNAKNTLRTGINVSRMYYNLDLNAAVQYEPYIFTNFVSGNGNTTFTEFYAQTKSVIGENLTVNMGVNANYFQLNNVYSVDPRFGLNYNITDNHVLSFGYGKHSQLEELKIYFIKQENDLEKYPNQNLELAHAHHFVLGYEWLINENLRFKVEPYYQYLYNVPGIADSSWSMINFKQDWFFMSKLENNTFGKNIGVDVTFERFLDNSFYYLVTASIFDSKYKADDGIWRNTRYDKEVAINVLFGKEFTIKQNKTLGLNVRFNYMGGERTTPVLEEQSIVAKSIIYDYDNLFEDRLEDSYYLDLSITYRNNRPKLSTVWALQIKNALGTPVKEGKYFNSKTKTIDEASTSVVVPVISYKIEF